jgi:hypothetical protein
VVDLEVFKEKRKNIVGKGIRQDLTISKEKVYLINAHYVGSTGKQ